MPVTTDEAEKLAQTAVLLGVANTLLVPVYMENKQAGVAASVALSAGLLFLFHSQGERNSTKEASANFFSFWSIADNKKKPDAEQVFNDILDGGGLIYRNVGRVLKK